jgi:hypothetical protein
VRGCMLSVQVHSQHRTEHIVEPALFSKFLACMGLNPVSSGSLSPRHGASSGCGWRMEGSCE